MIEIERLTKTLNGHVVLRGVDLCVRAGEVVAVVGSSGTGKSVLLKHIVGLMLPDAGDVRVDGRSVVYARYTELRALRACMGYVFQDSALLDSLTVRDNLRLALDDDACTRNPVHAANHIADALETVRLDARVLDRYPAELSGGMRKRVGVARAIINRPRMLLYDEPTTGLDPANVDAVNALILRARDTLGATIIVVTHDIAALPCLADRVAFLSDGRLRFVGSPAEFASSNDPAVVAFTGTGRMNTTGRQT
jgi:phospholipid/cholesterol/gamma-HCH transport system ATP-binding protein